MRAALKDFKEMIEVLRTAELLEFFDPTADSRIVLLETQWRAGRWRIPQNVTEFRLATAYAQQPFEIIEHSRVRASPVWRCLEHSKGRAVVADWDHSQDRGMKRGMTTLDDALCVCDEGWSPPRE